MGFSGYIWLDTKIVLEKKFGYNFLSPLNLITQLISAFHRLPRYPNAGCSMTCGIFVY